MTALTYDLDLMGFDLFETLVQSLLTARLGQRLQSWGAGGDFGRDAYSDGPLRFPDPQEFKDGPFIFQVKHCARNGVRSQAERLVQSVTAEMRRIDARRSASSWQDPEVYALITNVDLTASLRSTVAGIVAAEMPTTEFVPMGHKEVSALIDEHPTVRAAYPQLLGFTDLEVLISNVVDKPVRERSRFAMATAQELSQVFVPTASYRKCLELLSKKGFAVLLGPPEMGKTAIGRMICLLKHAENWEAFDCRGPEDFFRAYKRDVSQVFLADDAFGSTEYRPEIATEWAAVLDQILGQADAHHWIIWTSRPAP